MLCIAALAALAQQSTPALTRQDSIGTARQADAFLRAKDYRAGYDSQIIPALQMLSRSSAHRDSMLREALNIEFDKNLLTLYSPYLSAARAPLS